jgi:hypothetical protein
VNVRRKRWLLPTILLAVFALVLAACPEEEPAVDEEGEPEPVADVALEQSCENDVWGYTVEYPGEWVTNDENLLPECSAFDPEDVVIDLEAEFPVESAIIFNFSFQEFGMLTAEDETRDEITRMEITVDGENAVFIHWTATEGHPLYPEGTEGYEYFIERGDNTLIAGTYDLEGLEPDFDERRDILDTMMATIDVFEPDPPEEEPEE